MTEKENSNQNVAVVLPDRETIGIKRMPVKVKKLVPEAVIPKYSKPGDAGADITAVAYEYDYLNDVHVYHTGLAFEVPEGYVMLAFPRSSNMKTNVYLPNSVGVIDSGYRGEVQFRFKNRDRKLNYKPYEIGDRVGQVIIIPYPIIDYIESDELSTTERGEGGFGHTGK